MERERSRKLILAAVLAFLFIFCPAFASAETADSPADDVTVREDDPQKDLAGESAVAEPPAENVTVPEDDPLDGFAEENAIADPLTDDSAFDWEDDPLDFFAEEAAIADPLEPLNRVFFEFNDWLYVWFLQPVASNYAKVVPTVVRRSIVNFFFNLRAPVRVVNNLLQVKPKETGIELSRFVINTTLGIAGLGDPARNRFGLEPRTEDLGQTFGYHGAGGGFFIVLPVLGASNLRDSVGMIGDSFLSPLEYYIREEPVPGTGVATFQYVNRSSFRIEDYEQFKAIAFDPYLSLRDAYEQYRQNMIEDRDQQTGAPFYYENSSTGQEKLAASSDSRTAEDKLESPVDSDVQTGKMSIEQTDDAAGASERLRTAGEDPGL